MPDHAGKRVIFLDQGILKDRHGKPIHGVELFRLHLIADLVARGIRVTIAADRSWKPIIADHFPDPRARPQLLCPPPPARGTVINGLVAALSARPPGAPPFDAAVFGDARRGLRPAIRLARARSISRRYLVFSHRHPTPATARSVARSGMPVLAVSEDVARGFRNAGVADLAVHYGLPNTEACHPPHQPLNKDTDPTVRFILLGRMPNHFKGHDTAVEAFQLLPEQVRQNAELHLASFIDDTTINQPGVITHRWTPKHEVPDLLRRMDIMLTPSRNETFSQAIVQGMLTELPVIATPLPVFTEKLDTGAGLVCDSAEQFATAMAELARDPAKRRAMGQTGRRTALERYVWDTDRFLNRYLFPEGPFGDA